jgi:TonB family protein
MKLLAILATQTGLLLAQSVTPPKLVRQVEPEYPAEARVKRVEGVVTLYIQVSAKGVAENIKVVRSLNADLDARAIRAVQQWRFQPAKKDGNPVSMSANVDVQFRLPRYPLLPSLSPRPDAPPVEASEDEPNVWDLLFK